MTHRPIHDTINEAIELLNYYESCKDKNTATWPPNMYNVLHTLAMYATDEELEKIKPQETDEARTCRFAIDELSDRLSDEISKNIELTVKLRKYEEDATASNETAHTEFVSESLSKIFGLNPFKPEGTTS